MFSNPIFSTTTGIDEAAQRPNVLVRVGYADTSHATPTGAISTDIAATWIPFPSLPAPDSRGGDVAISADAGVILWSPDRSTAFRSTDEGETWKTCRGLPGNVMIISDPADATRFYAIEQAGGRFFVSTDSGKSFRQTANNLPHPVSRLRVLPVSPSGQIIFLPVEDFGLLYSTDSGHHFALWPQIQQANAVGFGAPARNHLNPTIYLSGEIQNTYGVFRSTDSGKSWKRINDDAHGYGWPHSITGDPRIFGRVYLGTNGRGIVYGNAIDGN